MNTDNFSNKTKSVLIYIFKIVSIFTLSYLFVNLLIYFQINFLKANDSIYNRIIKYKTSDYSIVDLHLLLAINIIPISIISFFIKTKKETISKKIKEKKEKFLVYKHNSNVLTVKKSYPLLM